MAGVWEAFTTNKEWEVYLKDLVKTNDRALLKAIVLIYESQTPEEKETETSIEDNNIGFTKWDAKELGDIAKKIQHGEELTAGELAKSRNKMQKYWKQLMYISKQQQEAKGRSVFRHNDFIPTKEDEGKKQFKEHNEILRRCAEEGIACEYGICSECPITQGFQMRLNLKEG